MKLYQSILDILYPKRCCVCGEVLPKNILFLCNKCRKLLEYAQEPVCKKCGKPIERYEDEFCMDCGGKVLAFDRGFAVWVYNKAMKKSIADFKYAGRVEYKEFYVKEILRCFKKIFMQYHFDAIVPVPLHKEREKKRGYNQAALIAGDLSTDLKIPVLNNLLIRKKRTLPQKGLNDKERKENLKDAFQVNETLIPEKGLYNVLLVDDIYTTGNTINQCAKVLKDSGVHKVYFVCLCIGKDY